MAQILVHRIFYYLKINIQLNLYVKRLGYFLVIISALNFFNSYAQSHENDFEKVKIEIEGEKVYALGQMALDRQGYIWMVANLVLNRYDGSKRNLN